MAELSEPFTWQICCDGYEIVAVADDDVIPDTNLGVGFYRSPAQQSILRTRGVVRAKSKKLQKYDARKEGKGIARRLSAMYKQGEVRNYDPSDEEILAFVATYGLLVPGDEMLVRDIVQTCKYLGIFAGAIDRRETAKVRKTFNEVVVPGLSWQLVPKKSGRRIIGWQMDVKPESLIAFAWLQIAEELTEGKGVQKCEAPDCLEWFAARANKRFCNNRCKMAYHRKSNLPGFLRSERRHNQA